MKLIYSAIVFTFIMSSCSVFQSSRRMDMSPFSENTRTLFAEAIKIERPFQFKHLRPYTTIPEFQEMQKAAPPILQALRGIVYYSNQVVAINNSKLTEKGKCQMLADYLDEVMQKALDKHREDSLQLDLTSARNILENIRKSETYLDALAAAEPVINSVVSAMLERIDIIQDQIPLIIAGFNREIEKDFAAPRENYIRLHVLQDELMLSLTRLLKARIGDKEELEKMLKENASLQYFIPSADKATHVTLIEAENFLMGQVKEIESMIRQLDDLRATYREKQNEVVAWRTELDNKILVARTSLSIWARAHKNLGAGIPVPPLIDVAGMASNLAGNAAKVVLP
jgi:hypothetical protein